MTSWQILTGDCIDRMREMEPESVDAIVTDPPYELGFMGKRWDASGIANSVEMWSEALRVLKPGGHLLAFGGTRTYHRMVCAAEDAGFEIRDQIAWMFGSGFPKSLDVSKAIDKGAGAERQVTREASRDLDPGEHITFDQRSSSERERRDIPATAAAAAWSGWGTALKPAFEPIVVARKPLIGTVAQNVLEHGTGAINVDGCRVEGEPLRSPLKADGTRSREQNEGWTWIPDNTRGNPEEPCDVHGVLRCTICLPQKGRWPANVVLDPEAGAMLDEQTSDLRGATSRTHRVDRSPFTSGAGESVSDEVYGDTGGASRFFFVTSENTLSSTEVGAKDSRLPIEHGGIDRFKYCAKTSSAERNAGLEGFEEGDRVYFGSGGRTQVDGEWIETRSEPQKRANVHPTVKPIALMRWLVRMVTPPGGTVLDPFNGSGSTGCAAVLEGFDYIGIEREPEYVAIAGARVKWWAEHPEGVELVERIKAERERAAAEAAGQLDLFVADRKFEGAK